jgi:hypothetical protein
MINPKELRLGNIILLDNKHKRIVSYLEIDTDCSRWFTGIPLTPEILEKCGFETTGDFKNNITCDFKSKKLWNGAQVNIYSRHKRFYYWMNETYNIELKSLHQLMNIFFALTNTELIYKP